MPSNVRFTHAIDTSNGSEYKCVCGETFETQTELLDHVEGTERNGR